MGSSRYVAASRMRHCKMRFFDDVNYASIFREIIDRNQSNRLYNSAYHVNLIGLEVRGQSD